MAIRTLGTAATSTLKALVFNTDELATGLSQSGQTLMAQFQQGVFNDLPPTLTNVWPGAFSRTGALFVPRRGVLYAQPGDAVAWDPQTGFPILISAAALAGGGWVTVGPT